MKKLSLFVLPLTLSAIVAYAQTTLPVTNAEIRKVDLAAKTVTLKHDEIKTPRHDGHDDVISC